MGETSDGDNHTIHGDRGERMSEKIEPNIPVWPKGAMTFTNQWIRPRKMSMDKWFNSDMSVGRKWTSKKGETPSKFLARIINDLTDDGALPGFGVYDGDDE